MGLMKNIAKVLMSGREYLAIHKASYSNDFALKFGSLGASWDILIPIRPNTL